MLIATIALPEPSIPYITELKSPKKSEDLDEAKPQQSSTTPPLTQATQTPPPSKPRPMRSDSLDNPEADPWGSPALHKGHAHTNSREPNMKTRGTSAARPVGNGHTGPSRTTSAFTTHSEGPVSSPPMLPEDSTSGATPSNTSGGGWGSYDNPNNGFPNNQEQPGLGAAGFGSGGNDQDNTSGAAAGRSLGGGRTTNRGVDEVVTITVLPEKEGMFMFQHRNYEVKSARRASTVIRRYSDFVWLLDCLHKRYPFRLLPLLPPKRVAGKL